LFCGERSFTCAARSSIQPGSSGRRAPRPAPPPRYTTPTSHRRPRPHGGGGDGFTPWTSACGRASNRSATLTLRCAPAAESLRRLLRLHWIRRRHEPRKVIYQCLPPCCKAAGRGPPLCQRRPARRSHGRTASCARRLPRRGHRHDVRMRHAGPLQRRASTRGAAPPAACRRPVERRSSQQQQQQQPGCPLPSSSAVQDARASGGCDATASVTARTGHRPLHALRPL
jgi:hypothetical protein